MIRYKQHKTEWEVVPSERPLALPCRVGWCHCSAFQYVPRLGSNPVRCRCKHLPQDHNEAMDHVCNKCESRFTSCQDVFSAVLFMSYPEGPVSQQCLFQAITVQGFRFPTLVVVASLVPDTKPWLVAQGFKGCTQWTVVST